MGAFRVFWIVQIVSSHAKGLTMVDSIYMRILRTPFYILES